VAIPTCTKEISTIVKFVRAHSIDLAVCGGGHSLRPFGSATYGGVLIELSEMREIAVDPINKTVAVQGGALSGDINVAVGKHGMGVVGGICNGVGVGGITLAGGYGYLTGKHGLALDNLLAAEIVLADGSVAIASEEENPELFWALRGAGAAFGVITSLKLRAYPQKNQVWHGTMNFSAAELPAIVEVINKILTKSDGDSTLEMRWRLVPGEQDPTIFVVVFHNGPEEEGKKFFAPLLNCNPVVNGMGSKSLFECGYDNPRSLGLRQVVKGGSFMAPVRVEFLESLHEDYLAFLRRGYTSAYMVWEFHNMKETLKIKQTETAFPNRGAYGNILINPTWSSKSDDAACFKWAGEMGAKVRVELERTKMNDGNLDDNTRTAVGEYTNYDGKDLEPLKLRVLANIIAGLGEGAKFLYGVNFDRLVALKKRFDPDNVFNKFVDLLA
jgi:FAD/FMN-containing dehydrogenase